MERMADSFSMMGEEERRNWSMESAADWVLDEALYADSHKLTPLPFTVEDVYETILAMIKIDELREIWNG